MALVHTSPTQARRPRPGSTVAPRGDRSGLAWSLRAWLPGWAEAARIALLAAVGTWLLSPFWNGRLLGSGDSLWYVNMVGDFLTQTRSGAFPVFVGQTSFAFDGCVYPLRVAPMFQHLAWLIDLATGRSLGFVAVQHACVLVAGYLGLLSCYLCACGVLGARRWAAALVAILYFSCPGILGTVFTQDLYMTWMTVPFAPLAAFGCVALVAGARPWQTVGLGVGLAGLWLSHSPIALWMTLLAAGSVIAAAGSRALLRTARGPLLLGIGVCLAGAAYPALSVAALSTPESKTTVVSSLMEPGRILSNLREVFPAVLLPVSEAAGRLSDLQLGYALWAVLALVCAFAAARRRPEFLLGCAFCLLLVALLLPVPGLTDWLWGHLPDEVKRITFYWPMQRFYLILSAVLCALLARAAAAWNSRAQRVGLMACLVVACGWSLSEARQFVKAGWIRLASADATEKKMMPENRLLMDHAYGFFLALPAHFSNGVVDPDLESRVLDADSHRFLGPRTSVVASGELVGTPEDNPGILRMSPALSLKAGWKYLLHFAFRSRPYRGVLRVVGARLQREYALPESGQVLAFGSQPSSAHDLPIWTEADDEVSIEFIPMDPDDTVSSYEAFAGFELREVVPGGGPVVSRSLFPYRVSVTSPHPSLLETPRMFSPGYVAFVDGRPASIVRSADGLVQIPLTAGTHEVALDYRAPWRVRAAYWIMLAAMGAGLACLGFSWARDQRPDAAVA